MKKSFFKVAQLSDFHITKEPNSLIRGVNTHETFDKLLDHFDQSNYEMLFLTGDLSGDGSEESYQIIRSKLEKYSLPIYCIPGNHDDMNKMSNVLCKNIKLGDTLTFLYWKFIFLNTNVKNENYGFLSKEELNRVINYLENSRIENICLIMHHNPIDVNSPVDRCKIINGHLIINLARRYKNIKHVMFGHVHNDYSLRRNGVLYTSSPAASFQFKKRETEPIVENKIGFKEYVFYEMHVEENCVWI